MQKKKKILLKPEALVLKNVTLLQIRVFADAVKLRWNH